MQSLDPLPWRLVDGIGPFFRGVTAKRVNWSKIPFHAWENEMGFDEAHSEDLLQDVRVVCRRSAAEGYNAITFDDLAHAAAWDGYPPEVQRRVASWHALYRQLFTIAREEGQQPLLTTDVLSYAAGSEALIGCDCKGAVAWLAARTETLLNDYPNLAGVVLRIGESDAVKEKGAFLSRLVIRTPRHARHLLQTLLPIFERHGRTLFFRLWTVGVYPIGDLLWNRDTFHQVFNGIDSPALVLSLKHGESDFFRYLPVNRHFFRSQHRKIVEFQARREYEGFGEYPSFVGQQAERVLNACRQASNLVGISVWIQTGGWGGLRRLTYLERSSPWVELNAATLAAMACGSRWQEAASTWLRKQRASADADAFHVFLRLSDQVIKDLLYVREFAERKLFFRRLRVPPLLYVFWDRLMINRLLRSVLRTFVNDREAALRQGEEAYEALLRMIELAQCHGLPDTGLTFQRDTFRVLLAARAYFLSDFSPDLIEDVRQAKRVYKQAWSKPRYQIKTNFQPSGIGRRHLRWLLALLLRRQRGYRLVDAVITLRLLTLLYPLLRPWNDKFFPRFAKQQAMGIDSVFR